MRIESDSDNMLSGIDIDSRNDPSARINLHFNDFYHWEQFNFSASSAYVRGHAFINECLLNSFDIAERFSSQRTLEAYIDLSIKLNGFYSIVLQNDCMLYAAVDRVRSIPLFYCLKDGEFYISDNPHWIRKEIKSKEVDEIATVEFLLTGYVTGRDTLFPDIKQLQTGEALILESSSEGLRLRIVRYYKYIPGNYFTDSEDYLLKELDRGLIRIFQRLIKLASGKTIVVPLSGGYDSRLIVLMLKRLGYNNVIAFSYGRPGNKESEISKKVAKNLGIKWMFVPYTNEDWYKWYRSEEFKKYRFMSCGLTSVPQILDWPAVCKFRNNGHVPKNSIFVPGHSADLLTGSRSVRIPKIYNAKNIDLSDAIDSIFMFNYNLRNKSNEVVQRFQFKESIYSSISNPNQFTDNTAIFEFWDVSERQSKYIINSLRVYEFWGYEWWIPFWDNEFMDFWSRIPIDMRLKQNLYIKYVNDLTKQLTNIDIEITNQENLWKTLLRNNVVNILKRIRFIGFFRRALRYYKITKHGNYNSNHIAYFGILSKDQFKRRYTGVETVESFITADIIRSLSYKSKNAKECLALLEVNI